MATKRDREKRKMNYGDAEKRAKTHESGGENTCLTLPEGTNFFSVKKAGPVRLNIIPYVVKGDTNPYAKDGQIYPERTYFVHRGVGAETKSYVCARKTHGGKCPICDYAAAARRKADADKDYLKEIEPKERQLWNVVDLAEPDKGVQLWDVSHHLFGKFLDAKIRNADPDDDYKMYFRLDKGKTLKVGFKQESFNGVNFYKVEDIEFKDRKPLDEDFLDKAVCLDEAIKPIAYKKLEKIFLEGTEEESDEDADEDEEDTTEETEDEDEEESEEDDKPAKKKKGGKKQAKEEEEEEDEDEDSEDEDAEEDSDEDSDESEDEAELEVGSTVTFVYKKKQLTGVVKKIDEKNELVHVKCKDQEKPHIVAPDDLSLVTEDEDSDEEDEDEKPAKTKKGKKAPKEDEDEDASDDDDDSDDDAEDEDEDEKPAKGKGKKAKEDDDDWEDDDADDELPADEEEEEEEKPAKKKKGKK